MGGFQRDAVGWSWKFLGMSQDFYFFYDKESMSKTPEGIVNVWVGLIPLGDKVRDRYLEERKRAGLNIVGYENYEYDRKLIKINCLDKTLKIVQRIDFGRKDIVLGSHQYTGEWQLIPSQSAGRALSEEVCP
jgi:hypothetical protein